MPAVSKSQANFFSGCKHNPKHMKGKCPDMSDEEMDKFARTPRKGLPERRRRKPRAEYPSPKRK